MREFIAVARCSIDCLQFEDTWLSNMAMPFAVFIVSVLDPTGQSKFALHPI